MRQHHHPGPSWKLHHRTHSGSNTTGNNQSHGPYMESSTVGAADAAPAIEPKIEITAFKFKLQFVQPTSDPHQMAGCRVALAACAVFLVLVRAPVSQARATPCEALDCRTGKCDFEGCKEPVGCRGGLCTFTNCDSPSCQGGACVFRSCTNPSCAGGRCEFFDTQSTLSTGYCTGGEFLLALQPFRCEGSARGCLEMLHAMHGWQPFVPMGTSQGGAGREPRIRILVDHSLSSHGSSCTFGVH